MYTRIPKIFSTQLHEIVSNPNPHINTEIDLDRAVENIANSFQQTLDKNSTTLLVNSEKVLSKNLLIALLKSTIYKETGSV